MLFASYPRIFNGFCRSSFYCDCNNRAIIVMKEKKKENYQQDTKPAWSCPVRFLYFCNNVRIPDLAKWSRTQRSNRACNKPILKEKIMQEGKYFVFRSWFSCCNFSRETCRENSHGHAKQWQVHRYIDRTMDEPNGKQYSVAANNGRGANRFTTSSHEELYFVTFTPSF